MTIIAEPTRLREFIATIFIKSGSCEQEAREITDHLVGANLAGHDSHGIGMVPAYMLHLQGGHVKPNQQPVRAGGIDPFAVFDAGQGYGQPAINRVMEHAADIAKRHGVAMVTTRNAQHIGRVGTYAEQLMAHGLMSFHFVNAVYQQPSVAPYLGSDPRVMTNPVCIGIPGPRPVLLDFATSTIALGKVRVAYNKGVPVAPGRLIDHQGQPTTNPAVMFEDPRGAQTAFGEHKGWGLAFIAEILGGAFTGGPCSGQAPGAQRGLINGIFSIVMEPGRMVDGGMFDAAVANLTDWVKASPATDAAAPVLVPGEPENAWRAQRGRDGIPVDPTTWKQILNCAKALDITPPDFPVVAD